MTPSPHQLPGPTFAELARGEGGPSAVRMLVAARRSKVLLLIRSILDLADRIGHPYADLARLAFRTLGELRRADVAAVEAVLDYPSVGVWAARTALLLRGDRAVEARPDRLAQIAIAVAIHARCDVDVPVVTDGANLMVPSLGYAELAGPTVRVRGGRDQVELTADGGWIVVPSDPYQSALGWRPHPRITVGTTEFLLDGWTPDLLPSALRGADVSKLDLPRWRDRMAAGWQLLADHHPAVAAEVAAGISVLAPLPAPSEGHSSVTLADAFGCVFLSLPPDARSAALALAHELQHAKLAVLLDLLPLLDVDDGELFYAPWRDDPRPLVGLLHGAYAHLTVAGFWRRQQLVEPAADGREHAQAEFARWRDATEAACRTMLDSGRLTALGASFVTRMVDVLTEWRREPVAAHAVARAESASVRHRTRWLAANAVGHRSAQSDGGSNSRP